MPSDDDFKRKINAIGTDLRGRHRKGYQDRDVLLSRYHEAWKPLLAHVETLAAAHLPTDKRLSIKWALNESMKPDLSFILQHDRGESEIVSEQYRWQTISNLTFRAITGKFAGLAYGTLRLRDLFAKSSAVTYALHGSVFNEPKEFETAILDPRRMQDAKDLIESWMAAQIAFNFDQQQLNPQSSLEITLRRTQPDSP